MSFVTRLVSRKNNWRVDFLAAKESQVGRFPYNNLLFNAFRKYSNAEREQHVCCPFYKDVDCYEIQIPPVLHMFEDDILCQLRMGFHELEQIYFIG